MINSTISHTNPNLNFLKIKKNTK